ncbi:MAG: tetratricopeptide repeat protein [Candidatus Odinarchaeota archaeon]
MTFNVIKKLNDQGKYRAVVDHLARWEADGILDTFTEQEQIECVYYQSSALQQMEQWDKALQTVLAARQKYPSPADRSLLLALLTPQIFPLCQMNRFDEAFDVITEGDTVLASLTVEERETGACWIAYFEAEKGVYYCFKQDYGTALEYGQRALASREDLGDLDDIAHSLVGLEWFYRIKGEFDTAFSYCQRILAIYKQMGNSHGIAYAFRKLGWNYLHKGEYDTALAYYQQELSIYEETGDPTMINSALFDLANIYLIKGEYDTALEYNHRLAREIEDPKNKSGCFTLFALIYYSKGELDTAQDYIQQALAIQETVDCFYVSGLIHHAQGELDTAFECLQQVLNFWEPTGNDVGITWALFPLFQVVLAQKNLLKAREYLTRLQQLPTRASHPWIYSTSRLAEALVLKESPRARDKFQAQTILEQLVKEEEVQRADYTALAIIQLCDLLIAEVKLYGELSVWEEAKALIEKLERMAQDHHSFSLSVEALLLRAKAATVDGNLPQALNYYEKARLAATSKNLTRLLVKVDKEQKRFEADFEKMQYLIQSNASLQERVTNAQMENYIKKVQVLLKMDMPRES